MPKAALPLPRLSDIQKATIETYWHEDAEQLLVRVWPDLPNLNRRTIHYKAVRGYLASIGKDPEAPRNEIKSLSAEVTPLTQSQEEFIAASYKDMSGPVELARTLFNNPKLMPGSAEVRLVTAHIRKIDPQYRREDELVDDLDYQPPRSANILAGRLNRYGIGERPDGKKLGDGGLAVQESRRLEALLSYLRRPVFKVEADKFSKKIDREVFESSFLSFCWDKPDLSPEHVIQYIQLASLTAQRNNTDRMVRTLDDRFNVSLEDPSQRLTTAEVDALSSMKDKASEHLKQINALIKTLKGDHAKLMENKIAGSSSMHPLVEAWKTKQGRERAVALAKKYNNKLKDEVNRLAGMDALKCELFGLSPNTIVQ